MRDGGPAFIQCRKCGDSFKPRQWQILKSDYACFACKRTRQNLFHRTGPLFKEKKRLRNSRPNVRKYNSDYIRRIPKNIRSARRKVATEIEAGRLQRLPCEVCGEVRTEAHHADYSRPLSVTWLCRKHHVEIERSRYAKTALVQYRNGVAGAFETVVRWNGVAGNVYRA